MMKLKKNLILLSLILISFISTEAANKSSLPRFASTKSDKVNLRKGPDKDYPIEWVIVKKNEPLEITHEYEQWRHVKDQSGEGGWVHKSMLSNARFIVILGKEPQKIYASAKNNAKTIAYVAPKIRCKANSCDKSWCNIECKNIRGWIEQQNIWGVYPDEKF